MNITVDQLRQLHDLADEIARVGSSQDHIGSPPAYYLKEIDKALPELAARLRALCATIESQPDLEARL
jgi:hypothetical protein